MTDGSDQRRVARQQRRAAARSGGTVRSGAAGAGATRWLFPLLVIGAIVVAGVIALGLPGTDRTGANSTLPPSAAAGSAAGASAAAGSAVAPSAAASGVPVITGAQLPDFQNPNGDAAVGLTAPEVSGADFAGDPVKIAHDGRAKAIMFIAHWCPHCQAEVPLVEAWVKAGGVPSGVDMLSVATSIDPTRPNYPPDAWLQREGWTVPVIADPTNSVASAYGLTAFPYWVFIGPDGKVKARTLGELPVSDLEATLKQLVGG